MVVAVGGYDMELRNDGGRTRGERLPLMILGRPSQDCDQHHKETDGASLYPMDL